MPRPGSHRYDIKRARIRKRPASKAGLAGRARESELLPVTEEVAAALRRLPAWQGYTRALRRTIALTWGPAGRPAGLRDADRSAHPFAGREAGDFVSVRLGRDARA